MLRSAIANSVCYARPQWRSHSLFGLIAVRNDSSDATGHKHTEIPNNTPDEDQKRPQVQEALETPHKYILTHTASGTRDYTPEQMTLRQSVLDKIVAVFQQHGAGTIDTPVFERKEVLVNYGDESKLIFDLEDQSGELLALRYDLTVPLARYIVSKNLNNIKRYHIGKVYRRDFANLSKGRYREFYQCDFDIAGTYDPMLPDAECIRVTSEILQRLDLGDYVIKLNDRQLLDGIFEICGVPTDKFSSICSAVDALDKLPWSKVRTKMVTEKGLSEETADKIGEYVQLNGGRDIMDKLLNDKHLAKSQSAINGLTSLKLLCEYCELFGLSNKITIDLSLARGLDYYTGIIFEAVFKQHEHVGSVAGGGRYDNLVGRFDPNNLRVPCVGLSIGVERILAMLEAKYAEAGTKLRTHHADIYVASAHRGLHKKRLELVAKLWDAGIRAEHPYRINPKLLKQLQYCEKYDVPLAIILGESELNRGEVILRDVPSRKEDLIRFDDLIDEIHRRLISR